MSRKGFRVEVGQPGHEVKTLEQWYAWREREDARMLAAFLASLAEYLQEVNDQQIERIAHEAEGGMLH